MNEIFEINNPDNEGKACQLPSKTIEAFRELFYRKEGLLVTNDEANILLMDLLLFTKSIYKPVNIQQSSCDQMLIG